MAVKREFCTEKDDQEILKRYSWYKCSNPFINFPNDEKEQEKEFNLFINLKSFGELNYLVRMRIGNMFKKQSSNESIYNLIIAKNYISSFKYGDLNRTFVCSYDAIKSIGINDYELIISFGSNECWKIISHRNFEIFSIIHANMKIISILCEGIRVKLRNIAEGFVLAACYGLCFTVAGGFFKGLGRPLTGQHIIGFAAARHQIERNHREL